MKRISLILITFALAALAVFSVLSHAAGTVSETLERHGNINKIVLTWRASSTDSTLTAYTTAHQFRGWIMLVITEPDTSSSTYAADNLDMTLKNGRGFDVMGGALANRDSIATEAATPTLPDGTLWPAPATGNLILGVTNIGGVARGRVEIYEAVSQ
jgi:hypothetical protein